MPVAVGVALLVSSVSIASAGAYSSFADQTGRPAGPAAISLPFQPATGGHTETPEPAAHHRHGWRTGQGHSEEPPPAPEPVAQPVPVPQERPEVVEPRDLKRVTEILPYFDYEPIETRLAEEACLSLCPCPYPEGCHRPGRDPATHCPCPDEIELDDRLYAGRFFEPSAVKWDASNLYHSPLYFEDWALERYGHTHHELVQPFASTGLFALQLVGLPYQATIDPFYKRMYTLGWYRPGECAPKKWYQVPLNVDAALVQAGVVMGFVVLPP